MLFSEAAFLFLFLPAVLAGYALAPKRFRNAFLTFASLLFYAFGEAPFLPILIASVALNYYFAIWISDRRGTSAARWILCAGVASDLGLLMYFKYADFLLHGARQLTALLASGTKASTSLGIALPLGISFFTFHKISYKVDVFRGHAAAKRNPFDLALYILFFPQLIAGPIVRYNEIAGQIDTAARQLDWSRFCKGGALFIVGLSKKMLIANAVAAPADRIFGLPDAALPASVAWLGLLCYSLQIYFDFSGYSDMAVGLACLFNFDFPRNFNYPYWADSITDFWRRWHISLSTWFRDYVYIPLGGNRGSRARTYCNLLIVFFLCGLWHGAAWNFVVWGLFHGAFLIFERWRGWRSTAGFHLGRRIYTLLAVMIGWVFFRAADLGRAWQYLGSLTGLHRASDPLCDAYLFLDRRVLAALLIGLLAATPLVRLAWQKLSPAASADNLWQAAPGLAHSIAGLLLATALAAALLLSLMEVAAGTYNPFIYFRF